MHLRNICVRSEAHAGRRDLAARLYGTAHHCGAPRLGGRLTTPRTENRDREVGRVRYKRQSGEYERAILGR